MIRAGKPNLRAPIALLAAVAWASSACAATEQNAAPLPAGIHAVEFSKLGYSECGAAGPYTPEKNCRARGPSGGVLMDCTVAPDRSLNDCAVAEVYPADSAFGFAALKMAQRKAIRAADAPGSGGLTDGANRFYVPFVIPRGR